jgi:hypothetical protein
MRFILRRKDGVHNVVVLRYAAIFYWLMWPTLILTVVAGSIESRLVQIATGTMWVLLLSSAVPYWPTVFRLKRMMKEKSIIGRGSKYSFTNPLTYEWDG